jgi:hypothetical protein
MIGKEDLAKRIAYALKASKENSIDLDAAELASVLTTDIDIAVGILAVSHEWDFAIGWDTLACTADEDEYTLKGPDQECWQVFEIKIGTGTDYDDYEPLTKKRPADLSDETFIKGVSEVQFWSPIDRDGKFPKVRIVAAPSSADYNLRYGYYRADIGYQEIPSDLFLAPLIVIVRWLWGMATEMEVQAALKLAIAKYDKPAQPEENLVILDPDMRARNRERNSRFGYGSVNNETDVITVTE